MFGYRFDDLFLAPLLRRAPFVDEALDVLRLDARDVDALLVLEEAFRLLLAAAFLRPELFAVDVLRVDRLLVDAFDLGLLAADVRVERFRVGFFAADFFRVRLVLADVLEVGFLPVDFFRVRLLLADGFRLGGLRPAASAALSLTVADTSSALSSAISCILSATVPTRSWAVSVASSFLPASVTDSVRRLRLGMGPPSAR